jgi:hypothetical protein
VIGSGEEDMGGLVVECLVGGGAETTTVMEKEECDAGEYEEADYGTDYYSG